MPIQKHKVFVPLLIIIAICIATAGFYAYSQKFKQTQVVPITEHGLTVGYVVAPSNAILEQEYDQRVASAITPTVGADGMAHYTDSFTGVSISYNPQQAVVVQESKPKTPSATKEFTVLEKRTNPDQTVPLSSLRIAGIEMRYAGGTYAGIDDLYDRLSAGSGGKGFKIIDQNNIQFVEQDEDNFTDGKTQGRDYYTLNNGLVIRIGYTFIDGDSSGTLMSKVFGTINFAQ